MQKHALTLAAIASLATVVVSQQFREDFNYPNGATIPGWTAQRGNWSVNNGRIVAVGSTWSYISVNALSATRSVLDGEFFFTGSGVQFAGLMSKALNPASDADLLMAKIQNNGGVADFDRVFAYERPGVSTFYDIPNGTQSAFCRLVTLDNEFWIETDADKDGLYELTMLPKPITLLQTGTQIGMCGYNGSEMDNFEFFDAVLTNDPASTPMVGQNHTMRLNATQTNANWFGMLSLGNAGFPVGNRQIPVSPDFLAVGTFANPAYGMNGSTDANGDATLTIPIPALPFLSGLRIYAALFTYDPSQPLSVGNISNEQAFVIQ